MLFFDIFIVFYTWPLFIVAVHTFLIQIIGQDYDFNCNSFLSLLNFNFNFTYVYFGPLIFFQLRFPAI